MTGMREETQFQPNAVGVNVPVTSMSCARWPGAGSSYALLGCRTDGAPACYRLGRVWGWDRAVVRWACRRFYAQIPLGVRRNHSPCVFQLSGAGGCNLLE